jgi:two-component system LytT family response regulator
MMMGSLYEMHRAGAPQPVSAMRVVVLEPEAEIRATLQRMIARQPGFVLVGESRAWADCEALLDYYLPELLITRSEFASPSFSESVGEMRFPVMLELRTAHGRSSSCAFEMLDLPLDTQCVFMSMERTRAEIYRRKMDELSVLMQRYIACAGDSPQHLSSLRIEGGEHLEVPTELVMFVAANGNYVRVHTVADVHLLRDTLSGLVARLDPAQFARVHRSFVVNRQHVCSVVRRDGAVLSVVLRNGVEVPIGRNYRAEAENLEMVTKRLSA